ncbi:Hpt domain-containing protein [Rhizobium sp. L1K21]|uniref:Hpt domain-containing protein n=1 Tax=Rhizobium sp. L1K21 TaxID=2954933 RepID=UPI0020939313|nr:Hpt domain-containing protein [Rhizobium sp. L1K21]MCO6186212.1 Hpt domain-containing protein [Rhizobium sp. L1K21]
MAAYNVAFDGPVSISGGQHSRSNPIDLVHLARQTMGDRDLELEILMTFARQARQVVGEFASCSNDARVKAAHRLKGAAEAVGAFHVSDAAAEVENGALDAAHIAKIGAAVLEAENFILKICR